MDALIQQVSTVSNLANEIAEEATRQELMTKHAASVVAQLNNLVVTPEDSMLLVTAVKQSRLGQSQKDTILKATSDRLTKCLQSTQKPRRTSQTIEDPAAFLTTSEVEYLQQDSFSTQARVHKLAAFLERIGCWSPSEPCVGKVLNLLRVEFGARDLDDPSEFYAKVQDLKGHLRSLTKNRIPHAVHVANYSTPDALPKEIFDLAFRDEAPGSFRGGSASGMGPLRKSSKKLRPSSQTSGSMSGMQLQLANLGTLSMAQMLGMFGQQQQQQPQFQFNHTPQRPRAQLALCDASHVHMEGTPNPQTTPRTSMPAVETPPNTPAESPSASVQSAPPLTPAQQAQAMTDMWDNMKESKTNDAADGDAIQENDAAFKKPAAAPKSILKNSGKGSKKGKGKGGGKGAIKQSLKGKQKGKGKGRGMKSGSGSHNSKTKGKASITPTTRAQAKDMDMTTRMKLRPNGCKKCRNKPGCCPSCFV